jgi:hypothetical protein
MGTRLYRRLLAGAIVTGLVASALLGSGGAASAANPERFLSHLLCWTGTFPVHDGAVVQLRDRFGTYDAAVASADLLCNPVKKTRGRDVTEIVSRRQHLQHYDMSTAPIVGSRDVLVTNQFRADQRMTLRAWPGGLLVPTRKLPHPDPTGLDHFTCYPVEDGSAIDRRAKLKDQFMEFGTRVGRPSFLCVPTAKVHGSNAFSIQHARANLACYEIGVRRLDPVKRRDTENQFQAGRVTARQAFFLCVPSKVRLAP